MQVKIIGENLEVTQAISEYIKKRIEILQIPNDMQSMEFRLGTEKLSQYVTFFGRKGKRSFIIKQRESDIYYAIDMIVERIKKSFRRAKERGKISFRKNRLAVANRTVP